MAYQSHLQTRTSKVAQGQEVTTVVKTGNGRKRIKTQESEVCAFNPLYHWKTLKTNFM